MEESNGKTLIWVKLKRDRIDDAAGLLTGLGGIWVTEDKCIYARIKEKGSKSLLTFTIRNSSVVITKAFLLNPDFRKKHGIVACGIVDLSDPDNPKYNPFEE